MVRTIIGVIKPIILRLSLEKLASERRFRA